MRKILFFAMALLILASCKEEPKAPVVQQPVVNNNNDSLEQVIQQREKEIDDLMAVFNEIQEGFRLISEAESKVTLAKAGEGSDKTSQIKANMKFIQDKMKENKELIEKLRTQLNESTLKGEQLKKTLQNTIDGLMVQMEEKDRQVAALQEALNAKDVKINEMGEAITVLNNDVADLKTENVQKQQTIAEQDKEMHMVYYVFGNKSELKAQNVLTKGEVLRGNYNKNFFTKADSRHLHEIPLYSKKAKLLTPHPTSSYRLEKVGKKDLTLKITDPEQFWHTSRYLVILVK